VIQFSAFGDYKSVQEKEVHSKAQEKKERTQRA